MPADRFVLRRARAAPSLRRRIAGSDLHDRRLSGRSESPDVRPVAAAGRLLVTRSPRVPPAHGAHGLTISDMICRPRFAQRPSAPTPRRRAAAFTGSRSLRPTSRRCHSTREPSNCASPTPACIASPILPPRSLRWRERCDRAASCAAPRSSKAQAFVTTQSCASCSWRACSVRAAPSPSSSRGSPPRAWCPAERPRRRCAGVLLRATRSQRHMSSDAVCIHREGQDLSRARPSSSMVQTGRCCAARVRSLRPRSPKDVERRDRPDTRPDSAVP
jgi:hypothetical protein